jgi:gluconolactonase
MKKTILVLMFISFYSFSQNNINEVITVFDNSILSVIDKNAKIEVLGNNFKVAEGPLWDDNENKLIFTDVRQNKMFVWSENNGVNEYIVPSGSTGYAPSFQKGGIGANGIAFDNNGDIILCQHGDRRVAKISNKKNKNPEFVTVVDNYEGKRFNSPNDLSISKNGDIYFTDPPYGFWYDRTNFDNRYREIDYNGVYKLSNNGKVELISKEMTLPNGIALSLDEKYIYVNNSDRANDPKIMRFDTETFEGMLFFDGKELVKKYEGGFDGLKIHSSGNIFTSGPNGILIISPDGKLMAMINYGKGLTNCNFDSEEKYLYVTGFDDVSRIKLK